ncbi:MAG: gliding motility-associated C-terminal domain-containing protein [Prevotella sp.]|nr:gliding motility-associated C-terminal domain-containing protein [Prevotella sp.]
MDFKQIFTLVAILFSAMHLYAQDEVPSISPKAVYVNNSGEEEESTVYSGSAPLTGRFSANPSNIGAYTPYYEWRFYTEEDPDEPYLIRYEQDTEYTFTTAGTHMIVCYAIFTQGTDTIAFTKTYWDETGPFIVSISESKLEMPNAFSPNGDGINDYYQAKGTFQGNGPQSIISFEAYIFNRWGQKLYSWTDCYKYEAGWDGTYNGSPVKDGVYFCLVKAKGADGRKFNIRTDVNLLRGYNENRSSTANP